MNIKKLFIPLIVSLVTGCYHNPFLADTYEEKTPPVIVQEKKASYKITYYQQTKDLKGYELKDKETSENFVGTTINATAKAFTGFTFDQANSENVTSGIVAEDGTLVLKLYYNRNKYTITFDKNSETATGEMTAQTFYYDVSASLPTNSFTYIGHVFTGWAKTADATEADFENKATLSFDLSTKSSEITLYAVWGTAPAAKITSLNCKITGNEEHLENKSTISTSRSITVSFSAENAAKTSYSLGNETKEAENTNEESLDFPDLTDGDYTFKVWAENIDGVKSEERTFSWTMACSPKLKIECIPDSIIKIDTEVNINVSGDNLESCSYLLNDGDSKEITLTDNAGKFTIKNNTAGDFTLTITGKNKLDETTEETFNWTVVETPVAKLSEVTDFMPIGSIQDITVSNCDYYMYKIGDGDWSDIFPVSEQISIKNIANDINTYIIYVIGGNSDTYSDVDWQSKETPTTTSWKVYPVYSGESLDSVLEDKNDVSKPGVDGKNIYASYDENFVYFGYEAQEPEDLSAGVKALCIAMKSTGKDRYGIKPVDYINETEDNSQPTFSLNSESLTHFLKVTFDTKTTGTTKFFRVSEEGHWVETASAGIHVEIHENGKCVLAAPRVLLASPASEIRYVVYMREYDSKSIYAVYPEVSDYRKDKYDNVNTSNMGFMKFTTSAD